MIRDSMHYLCPVGAVMQPVVYRISEEEEEEEEEGTRRRRRNGNDA